MFARIPGIAAYTIPHVLRDARERAWKQTDQETLRQGHRLREMQRAHDCVLAPGAELLAAPGEPVHS